MSDITTQDIVDAIEGRLNLMVPNVSVYVGGVPGEIPSDETQKAFPYVVIWGSAGMGDTAEEDLSGDTGGASISDTYLTVASGDPNWTLGAAGKVREALDRWQPLPSMERLRDNQTWAPVLTDTEVLPNRFYCLLLFRAAYI